MLQVKDLVLAADIGGTHTRLAIFAFRGGQKYRIVRQQVYRSQDIPDFPKLLGEFLKAAPRRGTRILKACIDFAGPIGPDRCQAFLTNLGRGFCAGDVIDATGVAELTLLNDFEAVAYGLELLAANRPEAFVRISPRGRLQFSARAKPTAVVIGAGTGLGTVILTYDRVTGKVRPIAGEGGHSDFVAVDDTEFRVAQWIRQRLNHSPQAPLDCEKIVSGPGLVNVYQALSELDPCPDCSATFKRVIKANPYDRPGIITRSAPRDALCQKALDIWLRSYARVAKNSAIFPLAPGGVFLAGGVAARILPELKSGVFMKEFTRCDRVNIRSILRRTPVFVITDPAIGLFGCANVAMNFRKELGVRERVR